jgi:hypothetical protein
MSKNTYWLVDGEGTRALVEGADERDRLVRVHGWTETTAPDSGDFVWLRNEDPALGPARLTWEAAQLPAWAGRGWSPGAPQVGEPAPVEAVEPAPKSSPAKAAATSGDKIKE